MSDDPMLQFFAFEHLRPELSVISTEFATLARWIVDNLPPNPQRVIALHRLLEAKDAAVRAKLWQEG